LRADVGSRALMLGELVVIRHSLMGGSGHRRSAPQSRRPLRRTTKGGESFDDVIQVELEFLHRHAKKAD
jgi:hypothetical protein